MRYQLLPVAGESSLSDVDAAKAAPNYLMDELLARTAKGLGMGLNNASRNVHG